MENIKTEFYKQCGFLSCRQLRTQIGFFSVFFFPFISILNEIVLMKIAVVVFTHSKSKTLNQNVCTRINDVVTLSRQQRHLQVASHK